MAIDISIIIPFLNENENISNLLTQLDSLIENNKQLEFEIIFVDDGSTDNSLELIKEFKQRAIAIKLSRNFGSHAAFRAGVYHAKGNACVNIYADLQEPLELIPALYKKINEGVNVVWAYREKVKNKLSERIFSRIFAWLIRTFVNPKFPVNGLDFVMFDKKIKNELDKNIEANSSFNLQILGFGFKQEYVPYVKNKRNAGMSKWTFAKKIKLFIDSFVAFSYFPIRLVTLVGLIFFILGVLWTLYIITRKFVYNDLEQGWPTLISVLMIGFGITNISLGIIAEYLWRTLDASRKRPVFIIDEVFENEKN